MKMATTEKSNESELLKGARSWKRRDLIRVWEKVKAKHLLAGWPPGRAFEYLVVRAFEIEGATVRWPFQVKYPEEFGVVEQIDGVVYSGDRAFLIESKDLLEPAAIEAVAKLRFRLESRPPSVMGIVFSVNNFTLPTVVFARFASPMNVLLWSREDLDYALSRGKMRDGLARKLQHASEFGLPNMPLEIAK